MRSSLRRLLPSRSTRAASRCAAALSPEAWPSRPARARRAFDSVAGSPSAPSAASCMTGRHDVPCLQVCIRLLQRVPAYTPEALPKEQGLSSNMRAMLLCKAHELHFICNSTNVIRFKTVPACILDWA